MGSNPVGPETPKMGFEPITYWLTANRSTVELFKRIKIVKKNYKKIICHDYRDLNKIIQKDMVLLGEGMKYFD